MDLNPVKWLQEKLNPTKFTGKHGQVYTKESISDLEKSVGISSDDFANILRRAGLTSSSSAIPTYSQHEQLLQYAQNAIVYACVTVLARGFQEPMLVVEKYDSAADSWDAIKKTDEASMYVKPFYSNPDLTENEFEQFQMIHLMLTGAAYLWKWGNQGATKTNELWPVPPHWVTINEVEDASKIVDGTSRVIKSFTINDGSGNTWDVPVEDMIYNRLPNPLNLYQGQAPLSAAIGNVYVDNKSEEYLAESVSGLAVPSVTVTTEGTLNKTQKDSLRAVLRRKVGTDAKVFFMSGEGVKIDVLNPLKEFNWTETTDLNETRICMVYGVPPIVIGARVAIQSSNWGNNGEESARRWMYQNTLTPYWGQFEASYTKALIPEELQDTYRIKFDTSLVRELQEEENARNARVMLQYQGSAITMNEARDKMGEVSLGPIGDVLYVPFNVVLTPIGALGAKSTPEIDRDVISVEEQLATEDSI